jgi:hypothetical protein
VAIPPLDAGRLPRAATTEKISPMSPFIGEDRWHDLRRKPEFCRVAHIGLSPAAPHTSRKAGTVRSIRACKGFSEIIPTKEKKSHYSRIHYDSPTDVRFDVKPNDSLVAPLEGTIEFSIYHGVSLYLRTTDEAASAPDNPMLSSTTRYRYCYRIDDSSVQLDYRTYFDSQQQNWVLLQGESDACWDRFGNQ